MLVALSPLWDAIEPLKHMKNIANMSLDVPTTIWDKIKIFHFFKILMFFFGLGQAGVLGSSPSSSFFISVSDFLVTERKNHRAGIYTYRIALRF